MKLKRVGRSNDRVTKGNYYVADSGGNIKDDNGKDMRAVYTNPDYWRVCSKKPPVEQDSPNCRCSITLLNSNKTEESNKMLTIETVTLINGRKSEEFSIGKLISMISDEEAKVGRLETVKSKSKAIDKLKEKHLANIAALIELLDGME